MPNQSRADANRLNARKSTGPRSSAGKLRASRNSFRHGLTSKAASSAALAQELEKCVREIAGGSSDAGILECARSIAQADLDLARVRQAKVAIIERFLALGKADLDGSSSTDEAARRIDARSSDLSTSRQARFANSMQLPAYDPSAEAIARALPELTKLGRYERRAARSRDEAIRALSLRENLKL